VQLFAGRIGEGHTSTSIKEIVLALTIFMAGWLTGAYMKPMPHFSTQSPMACAHMSKEKNTKRNASRNEESGHNQ
jgi:hypothetical protein